MQVSVFCIHLYNDLKHLFLLKLHLFTKHYIMYRWRKDNNNNQNNVNFCLPQKHPKQAD